MLTLVGQAIFYFLPSYFANAAPVFLDRYKVCEFLKKRVDGGKNFNGEPLFGKTKTWRGIIGGAITGVFVAAIQAGIYSLFPGIHFLFLFPYQLPHVLILGFLLGLGEGLGDLIKSFFKRRLRVDSSKPFFPFDQMSFLGALFLGAFIYLPTLNHVIVIVCFSLLIPVLANIIAYKMGWKKVWW